MVNELYSFQGNVNISTEPSYLNNITNETLTGLAMLSTQEE